MIRAICGNCDNHIGMFDQIPQAHKCSNCGMQATSWGK